MGLIWDAIVAPVTIKELIQDGFLSEARIFAPPGPDLAKVRTTAGDFNEADLSKACDSRTLVANVITEWLEKAEGRPTLCYGVDRAHAQHLQERFIEAGIAAEYIDCKTPMFEREEAFERYRRGETKVICNVATLDTGIDLDVRCIIDARPTKSKIRFVQTIGRGLRPAPGKDYLLILDHAGNHRRLGLVKNIDSAKLHVGGIDEDEKAKPFDTEKAESEPSLRICLKCFTILEPGTLVCGTCGHFFRANTDVVEKEGRLVELGAPRMPSVLLDQIRTIATARLKQSASARATIRVGRRINLRRNSDIGRSGNINLSARQRSRF